MITGFGGLGAHVGSERLGVVPDIMTTAKGLANAAAPDFIYDAVVHGAPDGIQLFQGHAYSGHPLACAAAIATMDLRGAKDLPGRARAMEP